MLFNFLTYLQPTHYFTLLNKRGHSVFPDPKALPLSVLEQLEARPYYQSDIASAYDLSWQALQKGYLGSGPTLDQVEALPIADEYKFCKTYFHWAWVLYVLAVRVLSFKNPITEFRAWYSSRQIPRSGYLSSPLSTKDWDAFESPLVKAGPKVSVIIPTLNRYPYLKEGLLDLQGQDYPNFEVLVVDQSEPFQKAFYEPFQLELTVTQQQEMALWLARNMAIKQAKGDYLLFFDDDSRVGPDWIRQHLKALDFFKADLSSGVSISKVGDKVPVHYNFFKVSDQLDTGNVMIKRAVFKTLGLFDRQFEKQRMGDGEFGLRAYLAGFLNVSNPYAKRLHLKVDHGGLRQMGSWDAFRTSKLFAPRPIPSVLYFFRRYFGNQQARYALLRTVPMSIMPYRFKSNTAFKAIGLVISVLLLPLVLMQVMLSWKRASRKLKQGPLIEPLA
ncbi:GT2 family glycosyltransferase [Flavobacteriaceae bacterium MAR_2010_72]|nr:GT2 family glycosyltransferase [Flavobacteriaceae bacterium MAR_2010_72]